MDVFGDIRYPQTAKRLLAQLRAKDLSMVDFLKECAYWALKDGFGELTPAPYPTKPTTAAFNEYDMLPPDRKLKIDPQFFYKNPEINSFAEQYNFVLNRNKAALNWLKEMQEYIPKDDLPSQTRIKNRIIEFQAQLDEVSPEEERLKEVFNTH
jgi:hypothetical protein